VWIVWSILAERFLPYKSLYVPTAELGNNAVDHNDDDRPVRAAARLGGHHTDRPIRSAARLGDHHTDHPVRAAARLDRHHIDRPVGSAARLGGHHTDRSVMSAAARVSGHHTDRCSCSDFSWWWEARLGRQPAKPYGKPANGGQWILYTATAAAFRAFSTVAGGF
jgi:hypothetical protein